MSTVDAHTSHKQVDVQHAGFRHGAGEGVADGAGRGGRAPGAAALLSSAPDGLSSSTLRPACFGSACVRMHAGAANPCGTGAANPCVYGSTAVAAARVEAMVIPADKAAAVVEQEASPDVPAIKVGAQFRYSNPSLCLACSTCTPPPPNPTSKITTTIPSPNRQAILAGLPALQWLPEPQLSALAANAALRQYSPGQLIFREGAEADAFAFLVSGAVRILRVAAVPPEALAPTRLVGLLRRAARERAYQAVLRGAGAAGAGPSGACAAGPRQQVGCCGGGPDEFEQGLQASQTPKTPKPAAARSGSPQQQQHHAAHSSVMKRPTVPRLALPTCAGLPPPSPDGQSAAEPPFTTATQLGCTPLTAGAASDASWAPLVHAIEAAMRWQRPKTGGARGGARGSTTVTFAAAAAGAKTPGRVAATPGPPTCRRGFAAAAAWSGVSTPATPRSALTTGGRQRPASVFASPLLKARRPAAGGDPSGDGAPSPCRSSTPSTPPSARGGVSSSGGGKGVRWSLVTTSSSDSDPWGGGGGGRGGEESSSSFPSPHSSRSRRSAAGELTHVVEAGGAADETAGWPRVVVELGRIGQGQCFGDVREGCVKGGPGLFAAMLPVASETTCPYLMTLNQLPNGTGSCRYSAVADAPCDVVVVSRQVMARALGARLLPLLFAAAPEDHSAPPLGGFTAGGLTSSSRRCGGSNSSCSSPRDGACAVVSSSGSGGGGGRGAGAVCRGSLLDDEVLRREVLGELGWEAFKGRLAAERAEGRRRREPIHGRQ
jgi:hypothetical protein